MRLRNAIIHGLVYSGVMGKILGKKYENPKTFTPSTLSDRHTQEKDTKSGKRIQAFTSADYGWRTRTSKVFDVGNGKRFVFDLKPNKKAEV